MKLPQSSFLLMAVSFVPPFSDSFVPSSTFVQRSTISTVIVSNEKIAFSPNPAVTRSSTPKTVMQMNLVDRFVRVTKGNLNNVLKNLESPEKIMNQAVVDMQNDLIKVRQSYAEIDASQRRLLQKKVEAQANADNWYRRAQLALRSGREELAKEALVRREQQLDVVKSLQSQMDTQGVAADKLYEGIKALEAKIREATSKKQQYIARAKAAESTQKVNDMLSGMTGKTSMDAFKRMEEKVEALEAAAEASADMAELGGTLLPSSERSELEREFLLLEGSAAVDDELKRMKQNLLTGSFQPKMLRKYESSADSELEKLKRESF